MKDNEKIKRSIEFLEKNDLQWFIETSKRIKEREKEKEESKKEK